MCAGRKAEVCQGLFALLQWLAGAEAGESEGSTTRLCHVNASSK